MANEYRPRRVDRTSSKMSRSSKVFLKVDREGLLTDTLSMSDVVNFDCYESIVGSVQKIVASFNGLMPDCIGIDAVFYYKKRARSSRMNPVRIRHTTDGFRAVAEHPTGEVPLGVLWVKKFDGPRIVVKVEPKSDEADIAPAADNVKAPKSTNENEIPEKRRRLESPTYKTYMPGIEEVKSGIRAKTSVRRGPPTVVSGTQDTAGTDGAAAGNQQKVMFGFPPVNLHAPTANKEKLDVEDESEKRYPYKSQYQWPDDVTCEVLMSYDGITERKALIPGLAFVVQCLLKGNYSVLSREVAASLCLTKLSGKATESLNDINHTASNRPKQANRALQRAPIRYLQDAKSEIFKVLTLLNLSRARFKQLLDWMKSLKLEEGKQGKFYLSERNVVGSGLHVTYDTNEEAAMKLNQIYKSRAQQNAVKVLHAIVPTPTPSPAPTPVPIQPNFAVQQDGTQKQIMCLLPQYGTAGELVNIQTTSVSAAQAANLIHSTSTGVADVQHVRTTQGLVQVRNSGIMVPATMQTHTLPTVTQSLPEDGANKTSSGHSLPSILRRKQKHPVQKVRTNSPSAVPMHLYRAQQTESDSENVKSYETSDMSENIEADPQQTLSFVKQEPVDYTSDTTEDYDRTSDKGLSPTALFGDADKRYHDVLKSDAQMPQSSEQNEKPFEVIIKSEPLDDY